MVTYLSNRWASSSEKAGIKATPEMEVSMLKIVIAPDSFKGSLSAAEVCSIVKKAFTDILPSTTEVITVPMADGGEGTLEALVDATGGRKIPVRVPGPLLNPVDTFYGVLGDGKTAVIEMAQVAGLPMVPEDQRDPMHTSSFGVGEVLRLAMDEGYRHFIVGLGGSATNDGGLGLLQALGARFLDGAGDTVAPVGGALAEVVDVDLDHLDPRLQSCSISIASDVDNPLCGPRGASAVFGPQKGASAHQVKVLDAGMRVYADRLEQALGQSFQDNPGAGAAGGLGFALLAIGATIESGARLVANAAKLSHHVTGAHYVVTGEGRTDEQTLYGKVPYVVAQIARECGARPILLSASLDDAVLYGDVRTRLEEVFVSLHAIISRPMPTAEAIKNASALLYSGARNIAHLLAQTESAR